MDFAKIANTPKKLRCLDCICLVCGECGEWICDEIGKEISEIPDSECPERCCSIPSDDG